MNRLPWLKTLVVLSLCLGVSVSFAEEEALDDPSPNSSETTPPNVNSIPPSEVIWSNNAITIPPSTTISIDIPVRCQANTNPQLSCSVAGTAYNECNISVISLNPLLDTTSSTAGYTLTLTGQAVGTTGTCPGARDVIASCFVYCLPPTLPLAPLTPTTP